MLYDYHIETNHLVKLIGFQFLRAKSKRETRSNHIVYSVHRSGGRVRGTQRKTNWHKELCVWGFIQHCVQKPRANQVIISLFFFFNATVLKKNQKTFHVVNVFSEMSISVVLRMGVCTRLLCKTYSLLGDKVTKIQKRGTSLVVQWLRLQAPNAGGPGSIPVQGTRSHMPQLRFSVVKYTNILKI